MTTAQKSFEFLMHNFLLQKLHSEQTNLVKNCDEKKRKRKKRRTFFLKRTENHKYEKEHLILMLQISCV